VPNFWYAGKNYRERNLNMTIDAFLARKSFAVAKKKKNREKYGNKVVRCYLQNNKTVYPINPKAKEVEGISAYTSVDQIPKGDIGLSIVTPPPITLIIVKDALKHGIKHFWMQPGAENKEAVKTAQDAGAIVISDGPCVLVAMGYHE